MILGRCAQPFVTPMHRGRLPACSCRHHQVDGPHRPSGLTASRTPHQPSCRSANSPSAASAATRRRSCSPTSTSAAPSS
jgi:hypothetical protein